MYFSAKAGLTEFYFPFFANTPTLPAICVFARTSLLKRFFVPKKAKTQNAVNIGLAKN